MDVQIIQKTDIPEQTKNRISLMIRAAKVRLQKYNKECCTHPPSIYYKTLIENTEKQIENLQLQIS